MSLLIGCSSMEAGSMGMCFYTAGSDYPLSLLLGKRLLLELKGEMKQKMGDKFSVEFFYNRLVMNSGLPLFSLRKVSDIEFVGLRLFETDLATVFR